MSKRGALVSAASFLVAAAVLVPAPVALAMQPGQPGAQGAALKAGDKAPALSVEAWIKGDPVTGFEKGRVYVVEFWATWCGPCIASMPHLSEVQAEYKSKGVTVIGTNVWEEQAYTDATIDRVKEFVAEEPDRMAYTVAYDGAAAAMAKNWMEAADAQGIPTAFVVNGDGVIAWIGHPMMLDEPLSRVVEGRWDPVKDSARLEAVEEAFARDVYGKLESDPKAALASFEAFEKEWPKVARAMSDLKLSLYFANEMWDQAYALAGAMAETAIARRDAQALNGIAWTIVDPDGGIAQKDLDLAMKAALKAAELTKFENAYILDTLAEVYYLKGDKAKAVATQEKAVSLADERMKPELQRRLEEFKSGNR